MAVSHEVSLKNLKRQVVSLDRADRDQSVDIRAAIDIFNEIFKRGPKGGYKVSEVGQRSRRILLDKLESQLGDFIKKSDTLFTADQSPAVVNGLRTSRQEIAFNEKMRTLKHSEAFLRKERMIAEYGTQGADEILIQEKENRDNAEKMRTRTNYAHWMAGTGRTGTASEYLRIKKEFGDKANEVWGGVVRDIYLAAKDPKEFERLSFRRKYGDHALAERDRGEADAAREAGAKNLAKRKSDRNFAWWYDHLRGDDKRFFDLTRHYGGGMEGRRMARDKMDEEYAAERRSVASKQSIARREGKRNFMYDTMDEYDRTIHDLTKRYGGDKSKADIAYRKMLQKEFPIFFRNSKMSTKDMHNMAMGIKAVRGIPLLGDLAGIMMNPVAGSVAAAIAAIRGITKFYEGQDRANATTSKWERSRRVVGQRDYGRYGKFFRLAGYKSKGDIYDAIGSMYESGLTPEIVFDIAYQARFIDDPVAREMYLRANGIDDGMYSAALFAHGVRPTEKEAIGARVNELADEQEEAYSTGGNKMRWVELAVPGAKDYEARTGRRLLYDILALMQPFLHPMLALDLADRIPKTEPSAIDEAERAAASLDNYQRGGGDYAIRTEGGSGDRTTTKIYQINGDIITDADSIRKLAADAEGKTEIVDRYEEGISADTRRSR